MTVVVKAMQGIGDQVYSRPFVRALSERRDDVFIETGLPELYEDLNVRFVDPGPPKYRTQLASYKQTHVKFDVLPASPLTTYVDYSYGRTELKEHGIISHIEQRFKQAISDDSSNLPELAFDLPHWSQHRVRVGNFLLHSFSKKHPIAVIRPVTLRKEWYCETRAPEPHYIAWCAKVLMDWGYQVISIANCLEDEEWIEGELPHGVYKLHHGQLGLFGTLTLVSMVDLVVAGPCFITPVAISSNVPLFTIFGGRGEYDNPHNLFDARMNLKNLGWAIPDNFCRCNRQIHACDKRISNLDDKFMSFLRQVR